MLRNVITGLLVSFLVSLALLNLNSRLEDETKPVDQCAIVAEKPFTTLDDFIRQYLYLSETNQQILSHCRTLPAFHLSGIKTGLTPPLSFSEITQAPHQIKHTTVNLLAFCCRLNI